MIKFSTLNQAFYDLELNYPDLPNDLIEVSREQHDFLLNAINSGYHVFSDLTLSEQTRPTHFHKWIDGGWFTDKSLEEIAAYNRSLIPRLSKRQFALYLYDNKMYDQMMGEINANPRFKIEYDSVSDIERLSPTVLSMAAALSLTDEQVDEMWREALMR